MTTIKGYTVEMSFVSRTHLYQRWGDKYEHVKNSAERYTEFMDAFLSQPYKDSYDAENCDVDVAPVYRFVNTSTGQTSAWKSSIEELLDICGLRSVNRHSEGETKAEVYDPASEIISLASDDDIPERLLDYLRTAEFLRENMGKLEAYNESLKASYKNLEAPAPIPKPEPGCKPHFDYSRQLCEASPVTYGETARLILAMQDFSKLSDYDDYTHYDIICEDIEGCECEFCTTLAGIVEKVHFCLGI